MDLNPAPTPAPLEDILEPRRSTSTPPQIAPAAFAGSASPWALTALQNEVAAVEAAPEGTRNDTLNRAAFALGQIVAAGELPEGAVIEALLDAARVCGLGPAEVTATVRSGVTAGQEHPRGPRGGLVPADPRSTEQAAPPSTTENMPAPHGGVDVGADDDAHRTELGLADRIVARHNGDLLYCYTWRSWLVWDGTRWAVDRSGEVWSRAKQVVRDLYVEAIQESDGRSRKEKEAFALRCEREACIRAALVLAQSDVAVVPERLNQDRWLLNTITGTIDLRTGRVHSHRRDDRITKLCPTPYDPTASCPAYERFLLRILAQDVELAYYLQRVLGYSLTGTQLEHLLILLIGPGANGKSTLTGTVSHVLGPDYAAQIAPNLLFHSKKDAHPTGVADLYGKRFAVTHEFDAGTRLAEGLIKQITGGDRIKARRMREDFWEFEPTHTLFLCTNTKPVIRGTDHGIWRRIRLIPFRVRIPEEEQDPLLSEKLLSEAPGILTWLVTGAAMWRDMGLQDPTVVSSATSEYREASDVLGQFLADRCRLGEGLSVTSKDLYEAYCAWHKDTLGGDPMTQGALGRGLSDRGLARKKRGVYHWEGVVLS
jgi:putative DNA primase/helicase